MTIHTQKTINPLQFILGNVLGTNLSLLKIKAAAIPSGTPLQECFDYFSKTLPAGTSYLLFAQGDTTLVEYPSSKIDTQNMSTFYVAAPGTTPVTKIQTGRLKSASSLF